MRRRQIWHETTREQEFLVEAPASLNEPVKNTKMCPKCGKELPARGAHFHIRACKG